ncbi:mixed lineage kinase domain-like protein [Clinocottus analis]|uniref:mixed lineage kinase domain-like protein n=1 Tax=Clinocottus analis TaxID=304258 RepID=UPI0035BF25BB
MEFIEPILGIASKIYSQVGKVKANEKRSERICDRVKHLDNLVRSIQKWKPEQITAEVKMALKGLSFTLNLAQVLIEKYTKISFLKHFLKAGDREDEFNNVNERLNDAFQVLSGVLKVDLSNEMRKLFELESRQKQDEADRRVDDAKMKKLLLDYMKAQQEKTDAMQRDMESLKINVEKVVASLDKPSITEEVIKLIKPKDLVYDFPREPFMTTPTSEVYKGKYHCDPVAIKRYTDTVTISLSEVREIFEKEAKTMQRFASNNILRMFGICIQDEGGPSPQFLIVMEFCEKGSLRQVLDKEGLRLSWTTRARMCRDAARGLYRLHQTEEKSKVHGEINSNKFLVAEGYVVKLGGLELAKTETSLRKLTKSKVSQSSASLSYSSPEMLDVNQSYNKQSEMYSFGIVLWEVATGKKPFDGWSNKEIFEKVGKGTYQEELPSDCPKGLADLIDACRARDCFQRPSAGVLVDRLQSVVNKLEES